MSRSHYESRSHYGPGAWRHHYTPGAAGIEGIEPFALFDLLSRAARHHSQRTFVEFMGEQLTYARAHALAEQLAGALEQLGVSKGDRVGYCVPNHTLMSLTVFACWRIGAVAVALNPAYPGDRLRMQMRDAGISLVVSVAERAILEKLVDDERRQPLPVIVGRIDSVDPNRARLAEMNIAGLHVHRWDDVMRGSHPASAVSVAPGDLAALIYTGGTTGGDPKAAQLTHANLSVNVQQMRSWFAQLQDGGETILAAAAFTHIAGLGPLNNFAVHLAATMIVQPRFDVEQTLDCIDSGRLSVLLAVPTMLAALLQAAENRRIDWSGLKVVQSGAAPLTTQIRDRFERLTGHRIVNLYGMTETSPAVIYGTQDRGGDAASTGVPLPLTQVEVRAIEAPEHCVPIGSVGEICIRGPQVMSGYWRRDELNRACFVDGYFRSGDLGYMSADGLFYVVDRLKDVIIAGGYNIYPAVVEDAIGRHGGVAEVAVVGVPDAYRGETAAACVALRPGGELTLEQLREFLRDKLSPMEMPTQLRVVSELPKTAAGKIARTEVRAIFRQ